MARSGCRRCTKKSAVLLGLLAACGACTTVRTPEPAAEAQPASSTGARAVQPAASVAAPGPVGAFEPGVELPDGPGREILVTACLNCHELAALALFKGFYTRDSWRSLVLTMQANGAEVDGPQVEVLSDYLARYFGPASP